MLITDYMKTRYHYFIMISAYHFLNYCLKDNQVDYTLMQPTEKYIRAKDSSFAKNKPKRKLLMLLFDKSNPHPKMCIYPLRYIC